MWRSCWVFPICSRKARDQSRIWLRETSCHPESLYRLLRALATVGVFEEIEGERFASTALSDALRTDAAGAGRGLGRVCRPARALAGLGCAAPQCTVRRDRVHCRSRAGRMGVPRPAARGERGLRRRHDRDVGVRRAVGAGPNTTSVGSARWPILAAGRGGLLAAILIRWPDLRGVVFDQPHVVAGALSCWRRPAWRRGAGWYQVASSTRCPAAATPTCSSTSSTTGPTTRRLEILRVCRRDMPATASLLLLERVIQGRNEGAGRCVLRPQHARQHRRSGAD